ncbi:MAG: transposase [Nitrospira bacterium HGW-Nitrospira-1]|nr:MAG: transposase [Nitrospira bacterium HGW-Nitrospira-1]
MPLPLLIKTLTEKKLKKYCENKIPSHVRDKITLSFKFRGNSVTIFENRAPWHPDIKEWSSMPIAQMRYDGKTGKWNLYCADRNDRWHEYYDVEPTKNIDVILKEIEDDPTGIFWG